MADFNAEYQKLNPAQRQAVDALEGPVMVVAGAGTGKTQTIALRIANILTKTQTPPSSILCLTFTDSAAFNMRSRLLNLIGPTAYSLKIHTFHSFCNEVIQSHPDYFILGQEARVIDQLEQIEIFRELIDQLPDGAPLKPWGDKYFYQRDIGSLIQTLKRENITPDNLAKLIDAEVDFVVKSQKIFDQIKLLRAGKNLESDLLTLVSQLPQTSLLVYHLSLYRNGGYDVGAAKSAAVNFKNALLRLFENFLKNIPKQQDLQKIYFNYQSALHDRGRYDFDDMILFVLDAFQNNPELLLEYQENFQYILVDEYQDTNSSQNQIIDLLGSYFDHPNIFVVGDDDQSIFRFQGASLENLQHFIHKYHVEPIVLINNYRSHQLILDSAASVINRNLNRLGNLLKNIDKNLKSSITVDPDPINLTVADSPASENYLVARKIRQLLDSGVSPGDIAILYRNNNDVSELTEVLSNFKINFYLPADQDILKSQPIRHLIDLLKLINNPLDDTLLFPVLSSQFINFNSLDLLHYLRHEPLSPRSQKKLDRFNRRLGKARVWLERYGADRFFNKVIRRFKFLPYCLKAKNINLLNQLYTFYDLFKRLCLEEHLSLGQFLHRLDLYLENNVSLPAAPLPSNLANSVQLMTAHKAKGQEFAHVFIIQAVDRKWGNNPDRSTIKLPPGILSTEVSLEATDPNEDERRLFYVALTRAKKQIYISYAAKNSTGRDQLPSIFISEIDPKLIQIINPSLGTREAALSALFTKTYSPDKFTPGFESYLNQYFTQDYLFNVTHLNAYLCCPFCFYHQSILKIPGIKDKFSSFGTAIHAALSHAYQGKSDVIDRFTQVLHREHLGPADYQESLTKGQKVLEDYLAAHPLDSPDKYVTDYDFRGDKVHLDDIPLTGKIDLIKIIGTNEIEVVDFKTGNPDTKYEELSENGDYFRQLVFYKLLSTLDPNFKYRITQASIDFVEKSKSKNTYIRKDYEITTENLEVMKSLIKETYQKILNLDFFHIGPRCRNRHNLHYLLSTGSRH